MSTMSISILSLIVAGLAVFIGPMVSIIITKKQIKSSTWTAEKQIISPIRQSWINELRMIVAEISSKSSHYWASGYEDREDEEYYRITELEHQLRLYLNPNETDHTELLDKVKIMTGEITADNTVDDEKFWESHEAVMKVAQKILKREWKRVKNDI